MLLPSETEGRCGIVSLEFFGSLEQLLGPWEQTGVIAMPADGPFSWVDRADAGEAAAAILAGDRTFDGPVNLTPTRAVTLDGFAQFASEVTGRTIQRIVVDDEQWVADQVATGIPEPVARFTLTMFQATRTGRFASVDPPLKELLGREPRGPAELLSDAIGARRVPHPGS